MNDVVSRTRCYECEGMMEGRKGEYKYIECGLKSVTLKDILVYHCNNCNALVPDIPAAGVLHRVIALRLVNKKNLLTGSEIKFLRKFCGYSVNDFAAILGSSKSVVCRFEKDGCGKENDRVIRLLTIAKMTREIAGQPERILRNVTVEQLNSEVENTFKLIAGKGRESERYEIPPEEIAQYIGASEEAVKLETAVQ